MDHERFVGTVMAVVGLLLLAAISAVVTKRLRFPYTVGLVVLGVALSFVAQDMPDVGHVLEQLKLAPVMIMFLFIPILIFESAFNTDVRQLFRDMVPTLVLAGPGLLLSTALIGAFVHLLTPLPLGSALIFGCLISATDPVAVIALFKDLGAPKRLSVLMEGESVFNDATAIVTFQIVLTVVVIGVLDTEMVMDGVIEFFIVFFGGLAIGLVFGYGLVRLVSIIGGEPLVHITLTLVAAYGAFIVADHVFETSGIMAVLGAGLVVGYYGPVLYSTRVREYLEVFWEDAAFIANSLIFLMLGLSEHVFLSHAQHNVNGLLLPVLVVIAIVLLARGAVVYTMVPLLNVLPGARRIDRRYSAVMAWGGMRGAIAVALAMSLPSYFPFRWQIIDFAFGVTLFMLLFNATTIGWLMRWLGLDKPSPLAQLAATYARAAGERAALERLRRRRDQGGGTADPGWERLEHAHLESLAEAERRLEELRRHFGDDRATRRRLLWLRALIMQHQTYLDRFRDGFISWEALRELEWHLRHDDDLLSGRARLPDETRQPLSTRLGWWVQRTFFDWAPGALLSDRFRGTSPLAEDEKTRALAAAAVTVLSRLDHLREFSCAELEDVETCRKHYADLRDRAEARIRAIEGASAPVAEAIQERRLGKLVRDREAVAARYLALGGDVAAALAERLDLDREPTT